MPTSKLNNDSKYTYDSSDWIVSLISTGDKLGGHAKIIIEGEDDSEAWLNNSACNPQRKTEFIAEYHIIPDTNPAALTLCGVKLPPALINTKAKFAIFYTERAEYKEGKEKQYAEATKTSWKIKKSRAIKMINKIKEEQTQHDLKGKYQNYQYAGKYRWFGSNQGHNCLTWCQEKLGHADIKISEKMWNVFGVIKAVPIKGAHPLINKIFTQNNEEPNENAVTSIPTLPKQSNNRCSYWCPKKILAPLAVGLGVGVAVLSVAVTSSLKH